MYTEFFGLNEKPFSISPDPRYLYLSQRHADALAHLIYGISESGGFIQLTGEVGTGKTTLIRSLLEQLPEKAEIALILNPQLSTKEFMQAICSELRIPPPEERSVKGYIDVLNEKLLAANAADVRVVLIVDEAQTLTPELLEQVRLLTNLETAKKKLLQIILIGQPELKQLLDRPEMRQIAQRVTGRYHLEPLSQEDTAIYIGHRMKVAGAHAEVFKARAVRRIYQLTGGIPRLINVVADRSLLAAYTRERTRIDAGLVKRAAAEVFGRRERRVWWPWAAVAVGAALFALSTTVLRDAGTPEVSAAAVTQTMLAASVAEAEEPAGSEADDEPLGVTTARATHEATPPRILEAVLADRSSPLDSDSALDTLFALWNVTYDPSGAPACEQADGHGLRCLAASRSSLGELRRQNLPAILTLTDSEGTHHDVVVSSLDYDTAELNVGEATKRVSIAELTHYWYGDYLLLWKPIGPGTAFAPGMRSESVAWIRNGLAGLRGVESNNSTLYDAELETWVRDYQRSRRLGVDGVVGAQTQIALQLDFGVSGIPQLVKAL